MAVNRGCSAFSYQLNFDKEQAERELKYHSVVSRSRGRNLRRGKRRADAETTRKATDEGRLMKIEKFPPEMIRD